MTGPEGGAAPQPWVLDASVLTAVARADRQAMIFLAEVDAAGRTLVIPVLAVTGASLDMRAGGAAGLLEGVARLGSAMTAQVHDAGQAVQLAAVISRTGLDPWDAHVATVADESVCPIITLDAAKWREHAHDLDEPLHFIKIEDPEE